MGILCTKWVEIYFQPALSTLMIGKKILYIIWRFWLGSFWSGHKKINGVNVFLYFGVCMFYSLCSRNVWVNGTLIIPISSLKHTANVTVRLVRNSCQRQPLPWWYVCICIRFLEFCRVGTELKAWNWYYLSENKIDERSIMTTRGPNKLSNSVYSMFFWGTQCYWKSSGLSTPLNNPGDSRFWTVSAGLQIGVWNLPDNRRNLQFLVDSTSWQWNFTYFAFFELFYY